MQMCMASQFLSAGAGGISRVARLSFSAAIDCGYSIHGLSVEDTLTSESLPKNVQTFGGDRLRFVLACQKAILTNDLMIYDFPGTARAHPGMMRFLRPFAVWMHGIEVWEQLNSRRLNKIAQAHTLIANSHFTKRRARLLHGSVFDKAKVCWLGTPENEPGRIARSRAEGPPTVLIVGRLEYERDKGHDELIDAWPKILGMVPDARLVIVGCGNRFAGLAQKIARSPAASQIDLVGHVPDAALSGYFEQASVFAMPSYGEGFGLVYVEAMRHALPVIASTFDAGSEINIEGHTGYNVDLGIPGQLIDRLADLLRNRDKAAAMGRNGLRRWRAEFSYSRFCQRFAPILHEFAGAGARSTNLVRSYPARDALQASRNFENRLESGP